MRRLSEPDGTSERIALADDALPPLEIRSLPQLRDELCARYPEHAAQVRRYFRLSEAVQLRWAVWLTSALLPMWTRLLLLRSPLMGVWRLWTCLTAQQGLEEVFAAAEQAEAPTRGARDCCDHSGPGDGLSAREACKCRGSILKELSSNTHVDPKAVDPKGADLKAAGLKAAGLQRQLSPNGCAAPDCNGSSNGAHDECSEEQHLGGPHLGGPLWKSQESEQQHWRRKQLQAFAIGLWLVRAV